MSVNSKTVNEDRGEKRVNGRQRDRGHWGAKLEYLLAQSGSVVGLGNVWRFPYLCFKHGGGAFLLPYLLFAVASGLPVFLLETLLGQYTQQGSVTAWRRLCPVAEGVGYAGQVIILYMCSTYIIVLAWALLYLVFSFTSPLPWASCNNMWNTAQCRDLTASNSSWTTWENSTSASTEFWERRVLALSGGIEEVGEVRWELVLCLLACWLACYFSVWKGIKSSGKVVYFTATFPYIILLVLLLRGLSLPGASHGIQYYLYPNISRLMDSEVWMEAGLQVLFSYSLGIGTPTVLGSYNKFNNNCYKDCIWICIANSSTSFIAGFAVFSVLGFMAEKQGVPIEMVAESGPGLAFIVYPQALALMPLSNVWAVCFFFMVLLLGIDTMFAGVETIMTSLSDLFPATLRLKGRREIFLVLLILSGFLLQLAMLTEGGIYVFQLVEHYGSNGASQLMVVVFESLAIGWVFGADRMLDCAKVMVGERPSGFFSVCWKFLTPLLSLGSLIFYLVTRQPLKYNQYVYPGWTYALGWVMGLSSVVWVPAWAFIKIYKSKGTLQTRLSQLCCSDDLTRESVVTWLGETPV